MIVLSSATNAVVSMTEASTGPRSERSPRLARVGVVVAAIGKDPAKSGALRHPVSAGGGQGHYGVATMGWDGRLRSRRPDPQPGRHPGTPPGPQGASLIAGASPRSTPGPPA